MSGLKRPREYSGGPSLSGAPPEKRRDGECGEDRSPGVSATAGRSIAVETIIKHGGVSNSEEQAKNRKLGELIHQRLVIEDELREKIKRLEIRQATDDASLLILNRYWNQFDENVRLIAKRNDRSGSEPVETPAGEEPVETPAGEEPVETPAGEEPVETPAGEGRSLQPDTPEPGRGSQQERANNRGHSGETATSFLATLASSSCEEMEAKLKERVDSSQKQANHVVEIYASLKNTVKHLQKELDSGTEGSVWQAATQLNTLLSNENERLRQLTEELQRKHSDMTSKSRSLGRLVATADTRVSELQGLIEELQWDVEKIRCRENRLNTHLREILERVNSKGYRVYGDASSVCGTITINKRKFEDMNSELEENRELAKSRLSELQVLQQDLQNVSQENNNMKLELLSRAEGVVRESWEYRCLQSQFSVHYSQSLVLKSQLDNTLTQLHTTKTAHLQQMEHMENEEVSLQRKLRSEVFQLEDALVQVRKEYETLKIQFEQTLAAKQQAGPLNREMRHCISTLQTHNQQIKGEVVTYKLRLREAQTDLNQARALMRSGVPQAQSSIELDVKEETTSPPTLATSGVSVKTEPGTEAEGGLKEEEEEKEKEEKEKKKEKERKKEKEKKRKREKDKEKERNREKHRKKHRKREKDREKERKRGKDKEKERTVIGGPEREEVEQMKIVRAELKKAQGSQREMKLLLNMYHYAHREKRDTNQLVAAEKEAKLEAEELKQRLRDLEERKRREVKKMTVEEALRKIGSVEEQIHVLNKKLSLAKQEEDELLCDMDVTNQALEDMQEKNGQLTQQLRDKEDVNFKLLSESIQSNQIHKLQEENEELADQLVSLKTQVEAQQEVEWKLVEKERLYQGTMGTAERELALRTQALDMNKRKEQESALLSEEVRSQLEQVQQRVTTAEEEVIENSISRKKESFNAYRAQEDISKLRRKIEKAKKLAENIRNRDEILNAEIIEYKARLTCPCCNSRVKDAILTKCFHVFCFECVKARYDTRQRKCPKCNAAFGVNDFRRIDIG